MATIKFFNGERYVEVEVTDEFAKQYEQMEREEMLNERKETRYVQSLEKSMERGFDIPDTSADIMEITLRNETRTLFEKVLESFSLKQRWLIKEAFVNCRTKRDIASELGVSECAVGQQIKVILALIQKKLKNFGF